MIIRVLERAAKGKTRTRRYEICSIFKLLERPRLDEQENGFSSYEPLY